MDRVAQAKATHTRIVSAALHAVTHGSKGDIERTRRILNASARRLTRRIFNHIAQEPQCTPTMFPGAASRNHEEPPP